MSGGLLALLDDVVAIAKIAAASLDDAASQTVAVGGKAAGIVIDDAAVTPRYVVGFAADRELPIIAKITVGSLKNKLLFLLPGAIGLSAFAPWAIQPLLMTGGAYLCFEGFEKVLHLFVPEHSEEHGEKDAPTNPTDLEASRVQGAIRTDVVLSAEIMAISLATVEAPSLWMETLILAAVAIVVTFGVYGAVALIVKADDAGVSLAQNQAPATSLLGLRKAGAPTAADRALAPLTQVSGRALVRIMPAFLSTLSVIGALAMLWVGGGIVVHGLAYFGVDAPEHLIHDLAAQGAEAIAVAPGAASWLVSASLSGVLGLAVGAVIALVLGLVQRVRGAGSARA